MIHSAIKRGTAELAILSILEEAPLHGYEIARRIERQTKGALCFTLASLYPLLYKMERHGLLRGKWEASPTGRRRRAYYLTARGKSKLAPLRSQWADLFRALRRLSRVTNA
jgi:DNA-binding PadR family transcriptional regulator